MRFVAPFSLGGGRSLGAILGEQWKWKQLLALGAGVWSDVTRQEEVRKGKPQDEISSFIQVLPFI